MDKNSDAAFKIAVIKPDGKRKFWTLVTIGLGAWEMNIPIKFDGADKRMELAMYVQPRWNCFPDVFNTPDGWPLDIFIELSRKYSEKNGKLIRGQLFEFLGEGTDRYFFRGTNYCGAMLIPCLLSDNGADSCVLPNNERVGFSTVFPLYQEECEMYKATSLEYMYEKLGKLFIRPVQGSRMNFGG
jgi:hypothetical protein